MKIKIRQGVFETNSSNTHSLSVTKEKPIDVLNTILTNLLKINRNRFKDLDWDIQHGTAIIPKMEKVPVENDESQIFATIIVSPVMRISAMYTLIQTQLQYQLNLQKEIQESHCDVDNIEVINKYKQLVEWLKQYVIEYYQTQGFTDVIDVHFKEFDSKTQYFNPEDVYCNLVGYNKIFTHSEALITQQEFNDIMNQIMSKDYTMCLMNKPYGYSIEPIINFL